MRVCVLGDLVVDAPARALGPRDRVVLVALTLHLGEVVSAERLADALWRETVPPTWTKVVQGCFVRIRKVLGPDAVETHTMGYRLNVPPDEVDVRRFERLLGRARELLALDQPERAMVAADEALALWRGRPYVDAEDWEPVQVEAHRLDELRLETEELRLDAALRAGQHCEVTASARAAVESSPMRERRWELLALAQYRSNDQAEALRTLREAKALLSEELGLDPGPTLAELELAILRQDPRLAVPTAATESNVASPWPGLPAYGIDDSDEFFGRDAETASCLARLDSEGVVVVAGASGSGKSSLVRAGIAASLRRNGRAVTLTTPAELTSSGSLAPRHPSPPASTVLVVDQLEEAVSLWEDADQRRDFFTALVGQAREVPTVLALRADRLGDITLHEDLARLVERGLFLLGPMGEKDLRHAIEGPARRAGLLLEPGLVDLVVRDALNEPGALPLMSHALRQTWLSREGRTLTVAAYTRTGGISGAVAQSAERVYTEIEPDERHRLRDLLVRLVFAGSSGEPTRVRVPRVVLSGNPAYAPLIERLVSARLLTSDDEAVELAHEALARAWPRLRDWLDEDVEGLRTLRHVAAAAQEWNALGRPTSELYRGVRLTQAVAWRARTHPELSPVEEAFLDASVGVEAADLEVARAQVAKERRVVRRLRRLVTGVAVLALIAGVASAVAVVQRGRADDEARIAEARRVSASALVATPYDRALLLAVEAVRLWDSPETRGNLLTTIARSPNVARVIRSPGGRLLDIELRPDTQDAAVADNTGRVTVYDLGTGAERASLSGDGLAFGAPAYHPEGSSLAVAKAEVACAWTPDCAHGVDVVPADQSGAGAVTYLGLARPAAALAWSPDGSVLAAAERPSGGDTGGELVTWEVGLPTEPQRRFPMPRSTLLRTSPDSGPRTWIAFSPDGARLYASRVGPVVAFDPSSGATLRTFDGMGALALSPDGTTLAILTASATGVALVDTTTGQHRAELIGHESVVTAAAFSGDGEHIATTSNDESVSVWDADSGERIMRLTGHSGSVFDVAFAADGSMLHTSAADRALITWDIAGATGLARTRALPVAGLGNPEEGAVLLSPKADSMALPTAQPTLLDVARGRLMSLATRPGEISWGAYSPDGSTFVTVGWDGATTLWRTSDAARLASAPGRGAENYGAVTFTGEGAIVVADSDGVVTELNGATLEPTGRSVDVESAAEGIRTGAGGMFAVTASTPPPSPGTEIIFGELATGRVVRRLHTDSAGARAAFSGDGTRYAFGGFDGRLGVIDVSIGAVVGPHDPVHSGPVAWVAFSPDGRTLAAIGFDGELTLSDASTGIAHARIRPGASNLRATVSYDPDGHTALIAYQDGSLIAYETDPRAWIAHACRVAGRDLTTDEWRDAFADQPRRNTCSATP